MAKPTDEAAVLRIASLPALGDVAELVRSAVS